MKKLTDEQETILHMAKSIEISVRQQNNIIVRELQSNHDYINTLLDKILHKAGITEEKESEKDEV